MANMTYSNSLHTTQLLKLYGMASANFFFYVLLPSAKLMNTAVSGDN